MRRLIVDGYNLAHAEPNIARLTSDDLDAARREVVRLVDEYCVLESMEAEVVFDAARSPGPAESTRATERVTVSFTSAGQSADTYIERLIYSLSEGEEFVTLVTADYEQQRIASGAGVLRKPPGEMLEELGEARRGRTGVEEERPPWRVSLASRLPEEVRSALDRIRKRSEWGQ